VLFRSGQAGWLRQNRFRGDVWTAEQLAILPGPTVDHDEFISNVVKNKLAFLSGKVEGQTITINTKRCNSIDIQFSPRLVNLNKPVVIMCNGKKRHDGPITPKLETLLETAYERWVFEPLSHLVVASLTQTIREDPKDR